MFNPQDISTKFCYKLTTKSQYNDVFLALNTFKNKHLSAFVELPGGCCFVDFTVKVTPRFGELIFEKGSTDESSSGTDLLTSHEGNSRKQSEDLNLLPDTN